MKHQQRGIAARPTCVVCGSTIWSNSKLSVRKYCSDECRKSGGIRASNALRYAAPKSIVRATAITVGQTVRVPVREVREIGGKPVTITGTHVVTVLRIGARYVTVTGGKRYTVQQIRDAIGAVEEYRVRFGEVAG